MGEQPTAHIGEISLLSLDSLPDLLGLLFAAVEVFVDLASVTQVECDDRIHISERQRRVPLHDRLGRCSILEPPDDQLQQDARLTDAERAGIVFAKGRRIGSNAVNHRTGQLPNLPRAWAPITLIIPRPSSKTGLALRGLLMPSLIPLSSARERSIWKCRSCAGPGQCRAHRATRGISPRRKAESCSRSLRLSSKGTHSPVDSSRIAAVARPWGLSAGSHQIR